MANFKHYSVMLNECIEALNIKDDGIYFDGTLGGGGHSEQILIKSTPNGILYATDLDDYALLRAGERLKEFGDRFNPIKSNFKNFKEIKEEYVPTNFYEYQCSLFFGKNQNNNLNF